jgi:hypothetical protein
VDCSPHSKTCYKDAHKQTIVRDTWVVTWKDVNLDGFTKPVRALASGARLQQQQQQQGTGL